MTYFETASLNLKHVYKLSPYYKEIENKNFNRTKRFKGFYISESDIQLLVGDMENFGYEISATDILDLQNYSMLYNCQSNELFNCFSLEHLNYTVRGPIIIIQNDQSDFDYAKFIKMFPKKKSTIKCKSCKENIWKNNYYVNELNGLCYSCYSKSCNYRQH